jgi:hypothetical protein
MNTTGSSGSISANPSSTSGPQGLVSLTPDEIGPLREVMRDLQLSVAGYYAETGGGANEGRQVRAFLVGTQTLNDLLGQQVGAAASYTALFNESRHSAAELVEGVKFARNVAQHLLHIVRPSNEVTLVGGQLGMRVYMFWDAFPSDVVAKLRPATQRLEPAYRATLEGKEVTETMMAVLRFFFEVAPGMVHRDGRGEWTGFPLLSQPGMNSPIHPEEPEDLADSLRWMDERVPGGDCRVICGQVTIEGAAYVYGYTFEDRHSFAPFVELVSQANHDIDLGYAYLEGDMAANFDDVSDAFPAAKQGVVLASRGDVSSWASPVERIENRSDWHAPGVEAASWEKDVRLETNKKLPPGFIFSARRARRLNALVPPH